MTRAKEGPLFCRGILAKKEALQMDAKAELMARLCAVFPGAEERIEEALAGFVVTRDTGRERSNLKKRIESFLTAKKIDGLSPKTLKNYRENLMTVSYTHLDVYKRQPLGPKSR